MRIDVILPTFNRAELLDRAIDSVLAQTYQNFILYIINDGSTDHTSEQLLKYRSHPKVKIYDIENEGVSHARNFGVEASSSDWISFLDSDDEWLPHKLASQVKYLGANPHHNFVHTEEIWIRNGIRVNPKLKHAKSSENLFNRSLEFCLISPSTVMMKRSLFIKYGPFEEKYEVCEDYDLWIKILAKEEVGFLPEFLVRKYGGHADQLSTKHIAMDYWRIQSLVNLLQSQLDKVQKEMVREVIRRKSLILIKGYQKHQNIEKLNELQALLASVTCV